MRQKPKAYIPNLKKHPEIGEKLLVKFCSI